MVPLSDATDLVAYRGDVLQAAARGTELEQHAAPAPPLCAPQKETPRTSIRRFVDLAPTHAVNHAFVVDGGAPMCVHKNVSIQRAHDISHSLPRDHDGMSVHTHASDDNFNAEHP